MHGGGCLLRVRRRGLLSLLGCLGQFFVSSCCAYLRPCRCFASLFSLSFASSFHPSWEKWRLAAFSACLNARSSAFLWQYSLKISLIHPSGCMKFFRGSQVASPTEKFCHLVRNKYPCRYLCRRMASTKKYPWARSSPEPSTAGSVPLVGGG